MLKGRTCPLIFSIKHHSCKYCYITTTTTITTTTIRPKPNHLTICKSVLSGPVQEGRHITPQSEYKSQNGSICHANAQGTNVPSGSTSYCKEAWLTDVKHKISVIFKILFEFRAANYLPRFVFGPTRSCLNLSNRDASRSDRTGPPEVVWSEPPPARAAVEACGSD